MKPIPDSNYNFCLVGAATDVGKIRTANEDSMAVFETPNMKVFVVCDGMGGHVGGQVASQTAIAAIGDFLTNNITLDPCEAIHNAIFTANEAILNRARQQPELSGMGSTCVMLTVTSDGKVYYGHVGDSRIYIIANHRIAQLTKDHSYVQTLVDAGLITKEQAENHPRKNEITNALGFAGMAPPTVCSTPIEPASGNCFLLCSDGLSGMVSDEQMKRVVSKHEIPIQQRAEKLVQMANENGGLDNITVQLVEFAVGTQDIANKKSDPKKKLLRTLLILLSALLILGGLTWGILTYMGKRKKQNVSEMEYANVVIQPQQSDTLHTYYTNPVYFKSIGQRDTVIINNFINGDSIYGNPIEKEHIISVENINGNSIAIKWKKKIKGKNDTIRISCETKQVENCMIKIPVINDVHTTYQDKNQNSDIRFGGSEEQKDGQQQGTSENPLDNDYKPSVENSDKQR